MLLVLLNPYLSNGAFSGQAQRTHRSNQDACVLITASSVRQRKVRRRRLGEHESWLRHREDRYCTYVQSVGATTFVVRIIAVLQAFDADSPAH